MPNEFKHIYCENVEEVWEAIKVLRVRGAPAIGIAGALGTVLGIWDTKAGSYPEFRKQLERVTDYLATSRPTEPHGKLVTREEALGSVRVFS